MRSSSLNATSTAGMPGAAEVTAEVVAEVVAVAEVMTEEVAEVEVGAEVAAVAKAGLSRSMSSVERHIAPTAGAGSGPAPGSESEVAAAAAATIESAEEVAGDGGERWNPSCTSARRWKGRTHLVCVVRIRSFSSAVAGGACACHHARASSDTARSLVAVSRWSAAYSDAAVAVRTGGTCV